MKYLDYEHLNVVFDCIRQIALVSPGHRVLKFILANGDIVEGLYEGINLGINGDGFHSVAALVSLPETDCLRSIELVDVIKVEAAAQSWSPHSASK